MSVGIEFERRIATVAILTPDDSTDAEFTTAVNDVLTLARDHLSMDVAFISHFSDGQRIFKVVEPADGKQVISVGGADPLELSFCQRVVDGRLPGFVKDIRRVPTFDQLPVTPFDIGAHLSTPIRLEDGAIYGTFCTFSFQPNEQLVERDFRRLKMAAAMVGRLIDAARRRKKGASNSYWGTVED